MFLNILRCRGVLSKLSVDAVPIILVPLLTILASISFSWTLGVFSCVVVGMFFIQKKFAQIRPRSTFFIVWISTSIIWLIIVFNLCVIAMVEILPEENFVLVVFVAVSVGSLYHSKMSAQKTLLPVNKAYIDDSMSERDIENIIDTYHIDQPFFCRFCQANVQYKNHCIWLNCCIGPENEKFFILGNSFGLLALTYGSNLAFTTVCHPFILYYPYIRFLLPDDCSDVYLQKGSSISFVCASYCVLIAIQVGWFLFKTVLRRTGLTASTRYCRVL